MTERHNLYAYTEPTPTDGYPGYVSLNREPDGSVSLTVRSPGHGGSEVACIKLPDTVLQKLRDSLHFDALGFPGAGG
jgi:hypothetical protein